MFGLEILDVAIGVIFVFLLVSILVSAVREAIESMMKTRAAYLWLGIRELLHDTKSEGLARTFYQHPLIYSLFPGGLVPREALKTPRIVASGRKLPSYIPSRNFAVALMDIAARGPLTVAATADAGTQAISLESIRANIVNIQSPQVQRVLLTAIDSAKGDLDRAQANIEAWYNSSMDRVSGWYKRSTQWWLFWLGLFVAVAMNVNTLVIVDYLYRTPTVREAVVKKAEAHVQAMRTTTADPKPAEKKYEEAKAELQSLNLPIGWSRGCESWGRGDVDRNDLWNFLAVPIFGWLITAFAATLGAPFWFDLLNKFMVIRSTVKPHEKSLEEGSEDRQPKTASTPTVAVTTPVVPVPTAAVPVTTPAVPVTTPAVPVTTPATDTVPPPPPPPPRPPIATAKDIEAEVDACGVAPQTFTLDEDLPQAEGGVR
jgi:hypothetical protein